MSTNNLLDQPILRIRATAVPPHAGRIFGDRETSKIPVGFVMLFDVAKNKPLTLFHQFLIEFAVRGRSKFEDWKNTEEAYADDGGNFAAFLYYRGKTLETATFTDLTSYAETLGAAISSNTGREFAASSRSRRVGTLVSFYEWAFNRGSIDRVMPVRDSGRRPASLRSHWTQSRAQDRVRQLTPSGSGLGEKIKLIPINLLQRALDLMGPKVGERVPYGPSCRDRLVAETGYGTGARVSSIADINMIDVLNAEKLIDPDDPNQLQIIRVRTKGPAPKLILVPQSILKKWLSYIRGERAEICREVVKRFGCNRHISSKLFLNLITSNDRDIGRAASKDTLSRAFTIAVMRAGGITQERRARLDHNGETVCDNHGDMVWYYHDAAANTFHHLRHTYVVMTYHAMKKAGHKNPWKTISEAIGHKHIATTIDTYAKHVAIDEGELGDAVGALLSSLDGEIAR
ncbi:hypothetical protein [Agrobacterium rosae]|uniref:hypothetical protein n=1 Tax=Agrobacterium rosae TaxID=1972867 RepID=UPI003A8046B5